MNFTLGRKIAVGFSIALALLVLIAGASLKSLDDLAQNAQRVEETTLNGLPGFVFHTSEGTETVAFEIANGMVVAIYNVRNPDKVKHLE